MAGPLEGVRIIDTTAIISGPLATMTLADQGADVIKVEPPQIGDLTRHMGTRRNGLSAIFAGANRNKRSLVLDLAKERGIDVFRRLVAGADVLVQNFRPGAAERMGIGYDAMMKVRPDLVYASIAGYGHSGPHSGRRVYDPLIQAASGMAAAQGMDPGTDGKPRLVRSIVCDKVTALTAAQAITAALFARERGAGGQHVRLAMLDAALAFHWCDMMWNQAFLGDDVIVTHELADMFRVSRTQDGWVVVISGSDAEFRGACNAFGRTDLLEDSRFLTLPDRVEHVGELWSWLESEIAARSSDELCALLDEHEVPCCKVNSMDELWNDPQVCHNGRATTVEHPVGGSMRQIEPAIDFDATPATVRSLAPALGEHSDEILAEFGLSAEERAGLRQEGVLG